EIEFAPSAGGGNIRKRLSTTLSRTPFPHPTQFQLNNPFHQPGLRPKMCILKRTPVDDQVSREVDFAAEKGLNFDSIYQHNRMRYSESTFDLQILSAQVVPRNIPIDFLRRRIFESLGQLTS